MAVAGPSTELKNLERRVVANASEFFNQDNTHVDIERYVPRIARLFDDHTKAYDLLETWLPIIMDPELKQSRYEFKIKDFYDMLANIGNAPYDPMILMTALQYEVEKQSEAMQVYVSRLPDLSELLPPKIQTGGRVPPEYIDESE